MSERSGERRTPFRRVISLVGSILPEIDFGDPLANASSEQRRRDQQVLVVDSLEMKLAIDEAMGVINPPLQPPVLALEPGPVPEQG